MLTKRLATFCCFKRSFFEGGGSHNIKVELHERYITRVCKIQGLYSLYIQKNDFYVFHKSFLILRLIILEFTVYFRMKSKDLW